MKPVTETSGCTGKASESFDRSVLTSQGESKALHRQCKPGWAWSLLSGGLLARLGRLVQTGHYFLFPGSSADHQGLARHSEGSKKKSHGRLCEGAPGRRLAIRVAGGGGVVFLCIWFCVLGGKWEAQTDPTHLYI